MRKPSTSLLLLVALLSVSHHLCAASTSGSIQAQPDNTAPALDLRINYYNKILTPEGVTKETRYEEIMLRRPGHVWIERILPKQSNAHLTESAEKGHTHKQFNHVTTPRHIFIDNGQTKIEFIDKNQKELISIPAAEFNNVNFDGSWDNAFYLLNPKLIKEIPLSKRQSTITNAKWHEREINGSFQRILWDEQKQIPLSIETGDKHGFIFRKLDIQIENKLNAQLPWKQAQSYSRKEYADFLD
ncbi:hypothetical protein [Undibacterium rugosum]|nr:hypothetical protein [Undibacterium rugosum]